MNLRALGSVILGLAAWQALFMTVGISFGLLWPDYRMAARTFFATQDFSLFTIPMMLTNFALFAIAGAISGWLGSWIGGTKKTGYVIAGVAFAYAAFQHFYQLWGVLPDWYNLVVPWVIGGSILLGARLTAIPRSTPI